MGIVETLSNAIAGNGLSMMIPIVTLLTFTHLRASHLSCRVRENVKELLYEVSNLTEENSVQNDHKYSLKTQTDLFLARHKSMSIVFVMLTVTLMLAMLSIPLCGSDLETLKSVGLTLSGLSIICLIFALLILGKEFITGNSTLSEHVEITKRNKS